MLTYDEALERILAATPEPKAEEHTFSFRVQHSIPILRDVIAPMDLPPFDNSAVDGFAVRLADTLTATPQSRVCLKIVEEIAAGSYSERELQSGEAARIFTGAPLPPGADALVMVEDTETEGETVRIYAPGDSRFIRKTGSDIRRGEVALPAGSLLGAGEVSLLSALNISTISSASILHISIVTTGDEIVAPLRSYQWHTNRQGITSLGPRMPPAHATTTLQRGQIFDANGPLLETAIDHGVVYHSVHVPDDPEELRRVLTHLSETDVDMIIASGGVSVGERDYVKQVVQ